MLIAHKIALVPNLAQVDYFTRAVGTARFAYNWALVEWRRQYRAWNADNTLPKPSYPALCRLLNEVKRVQFPWMLEVTKCAPQMAIVQLGRAFQNFFAGRARYPKFRRKGLHDRFTITNDKFRLDGSRIRISHLGWVRMHETLRFVGKILSATISRVANRWYVSITVDTQCTQPCEADSRYADNQGVVGVDLGISALATLSTGEPPIPGPKAHKGLLNRLRRLSRRLSRKQKGSRNRDKAKKKLARVHARVANIRNDALHKLTTGLVRRFHTIGVEDLNVKGMMCNPYLSRSIADMGFFEFRRQLTYKALMYGRSVIVADRWFASSKTCSDCGHKLTELHLSVRQWTCPACGVLHDRDLNAAMNLMNMAASSAVAACGEVGSGSGCQRE